MSDTFADVTAEDVARAAGGSLDGLDDIHWALGRADDGTVCVVWESSYDGALVRASPVDGSLWVAEAWAARGHESMDLGMLRLAWAHLRQEEAPTFVCSVGADALVGCCWGGRGDSTADRMAENLADVGREARRQDDADVLAQHAQDVALETYGGAVPFQAEGTWCGYPFYFRYRHGYATLSIAVGEDDPVELPAWRSGLVFGGEYDGSLTFEEFCLLLCLLSTRLSRAPYPFRFDIAAPPPRDFPLREQSIGKSATLYGQTPEEALRKAENAPYWSGVVFAATPTNADHRVFPSSDPVFPVNADSVAQAETLVASR